MPDVSTVRVLHRVVSLAQETMPEMTLRALVLLFAVAEEEGQTVSAYAQTTGYPLQTTSRILADLAGYSRTGVQVERVPLLSRDPSPTNMREVHYSLSTQGRHLLRQMARFMSHSHVSHE